MKVIILLLTVMLASGVAAESKNIDKIDYVYVLDMEKSFEFSGGSEHECGSSLYRATGTTEDIVNRKFTLLLAAYTAGKKVVINTEGCAGNRMKFGWVRIVD